MTKKKFEAFNQEGKYTNIYVWPNNIISQYAHLNIPSVLFHFCDMVCLNNEDLEMYVKIKLNSKKGLFLIEKETK